MSYQYGSIEADQHDSSSNRAMIANIYDVADQVEGWTYDGADNLTIDGTTRYSYDATNDPR